MCQFGLPAEAVEAANKGGKCPLPPCPLMVQGGADPASAFQLGPPIPVGYSPGREVQPCLKCVSDVEAFAKAMQNNAKSEQKEGNTKDKKDEEEDMSLD